MIAPPTRHLLALAGAAAILAACNQDPAESDTGVIPIGDVGGDTSLPDTQAEPDTTPDTGAPDSDPADTTDVALDDADDAAPEDVAPPRSCDSDAECDDGVACTADRCDLDAGYCVWAPAAGQCFVQGVCYAAGESRPGAPCLACNPATNATRFSPRDAGTACDDDNACTVGDVCGEAGTCSGEALVCNDGSDCTADTCDPELGCVAAPVFDGEVCDDSDACTTDDACWNGRCLGLPATCDDGNDCTADTCDPAGGCGNTPLDAVACDDGDACSSDDVCVAGTCEPGGPTNCEDGNACTIDICDRFAGCAYLPNLNPCCTGTVSICDDLDPCTTDICEPESGACSYAPNTAVCNDGDACTVRDSCVDGACDGSPRDCDDGNPCTEDSCDPRSGCVSRPISDVACDDGLACTTGDTCSAGVCTPAVDDCRCDPVFGRQAVKLTALRIGEGGHPGQALDLDLNPSTCAPASNCSAGRHNALGVIAPFANEPLGESVAEGSLILVLDIDDVDLNPFRLSLHQAELDPDNAACDVQAAACDYFVDGSSLRRDTCAPLVSLTATRAGSTITAGGRGTTFPFTLPFGESSITITLYDVRFEGTATIEGGRVTALTGVLGGAVPKAELLAALGSLPPGTLPVDAATVENLLRVLVQDDIDTNGDGRPDAASIGIPLQGIDARLTGVVW